MQLGSCEHAEYRYISLDILNEQLTKYHMNNAKKE